MIEKGRKRRGHSRFIIFFAIILVTLGCLSVFGYKELGKASWLNIKTIRISGNDNVSEATIRAILQEYIGENLVKLKTGNVRKKLSVIKRIQKASFTRIYPSTLKIKIYEKKGFLYLKSSDGDLFPIDKNGLIMEYAVFPSKEDLPIVDTPIPSRKFMVGKTVRYPFLSRIIDLQNQIMDERPEFLASISEYYEEKGLLVIVDAKYGNRIIMGDQNLSDQLRRYQFVQDNEDINRRNIFDLRYKNQVVLRQEIQ